MYYILINAGNEAVSAVMTDNLFHEYTCGVKKARFTTVDKDGIVVDRGLHVISDDSIHTSLDFEQNNSNNANHTLVNNDTSSCKSNVTSEGNNESNRIVNNDKFILNKGEIVTNKKYFLNEKNF